MDIKGTLYTVTDSLKGVVSMGLSLVAVFLMVDILFGVTTNIVSNVSALIGSFIDGGLIGLIALLVFMAIFSDKPAAR